MLRIGIAGPISLDPFSDIIPPGSLPPKIYSFPLIGALARALFENGHSLHIFALSTDITEPRKITAGRLSLSILPMRKRGTAYDFYRQERRFLTAAMRESDCDIIHAHWTYEFAAAAQESGKKTLITAHDSALVVSRYFLGTTGALFWIMRSLLGLYVLRRAGNLTSVSPYVDRHLRLICPQSARRAIVPNGVDEKLFALGRQRLDIGLPAGPITLASVLEGFSPRKNAETAIRAFQTLYPSHPNMRMRLYGTDFGPGERAQAWAASQGPLGGLEFVGKVPQERLFRDLTEQTHLLVHPSLEEAHPMALCEAMALGIPIVGGSTSGGVSFTLAEGRVGHLCNMRSEKALCAEILSILRNFQDVHSKAKLAWEFARDHFTVTRMTHLYESLYKDIFGR